MLALHLFIEADKTRLPGATYENVLKILGSLSSLTHTTFEESVLYSRHGSCTGLFPGRIVSRGYVQARPRHKYSYSR